MKILIISATEFEIKPLVSFLKKKSTQDDSGCFFINGTLIKPFITGVGIPYTIYSLTKVLLSKKFDLVINLGIGGAINDQLNLGEVVEVSTDRFADLGVEEKDGSFTDVFEMDLINPSTFPFENSQIINPATAAFNFLKKVKAITVNKVHGSLDSINKIKAKYPEAEIESMEGAAVALVCKSEGVNFLQIRAISNYVEPRNRENWQIGEAIKNLNKVAEELIINLSQLVVSQGNY